MPNHDDLYDDEDSDPPLTMGRGRRAAPTRSRGPMPVTLILSVIALLGVGGGVAYLYRAGLKAPDDAPRNLGAPLQDVRAPAPPQAQNPDAAAGLSISKDEPTVNAVAPTLAPPPEEPLPVTASQPPPSGASTSAAPATVAPAKPPAPARPQTIDSLMAQSAPAKKLATSASRPATTTTAAASMAAGTDAQGDHVLQIGAFSTRALANEEWAKAGEIAPGGMIGKGKHITPVVRDGQTLYRATITGFATRAQALALCERLKAAGGHCFAP